MGFSFPAEVREVLVTGGQPVKKGDLLIRARDEDVVAALKLQELAAETPLDIDRAQAALDLAQIQFDSVSKARSGGGGSQYEYDQAANNLRTKQIELELAKLTQEQRLVAVEQRKAELARYRLVAPFDGTVDVVIRQVGQVVNDSEPVIRVVDTDPLWIDVPAAIDRTLTLGLKPGSPAWILLDVPGETRVYPGKVIEVSAVADSASGTRRVRVEAPNPDGWPAGLTCWVRFEAPTGEWASLVREAPAASDEGAAEPAGTTVGAAR